MLWLLVGVSRPAAAGSPDLLLVTIDTIRADALAPWGGGAGLAPTLEVLARHGTVVERTIAAAPLTLPAHASLLTGLDPPRHGLRDNGVGSLPAGLPTLATALAAAGYDTLAVVGSRVLDRRFGLDRGFAAYDDGAPAERLGQYGYPERDAIDVTDAALAQLAGRDAARPFFLWAHYYDPHAPYEPADGSGTADPRESWRREIALVDRELGRLLAALPARPRLVAVVGDHGEAFGEHGEQGHGLLLHEPTLAVPLLFAGPGISAGRRVAGTFGAVRLASTLLALLGRPPLPGSAAAIPLGGEAEPQPILSETWLPWSAWGWSPLQAVTEGRWRLLLAPRPRLFDLVADPGESVDASERERRTARRLERALDGLDDPAQRRAAAPGGDAETAATLRSLGYLGAGSGRDPATADVRALARSGLRDPFDGPALLAEHERAKRLLDGGDLAAARTILDRLVTQSPASVPFRSTRAGARAAAGDLAGALADLDAAVAHAPALDFVHLQRGDLLARMGRQADAEAAWAETLTLNPRQAAAWLALAEAAARAGDVGRERATLEQGVAAGCQSASLHLRLGQLDLAKAPLLAVEQARRATAIAPGWALAWRLRAEAAARAGLAAEAADSRAEVRRLESPR